GQIGRNDVCCETGREYPSRHSRSLRGFDLTNAGTSVVDRRIGGAHRSVYSRAAAADQSSHCRMTTPAAAEPARRSFAALRHPGYRGFFFSFAGAMMADSIEHVISYWMLYQKFQSNALGAFAVISHWVPFLLLSLPVGALADRVDPRRLIQIGMVLFMS